MHWLLLAAACVRTESPPGTRADEICDNGVDDDVDGYLDCDDTDCIGACEERCDDDIDNDGDGLVDCVDPACFGACVEACDDGVDNDADGRVDCGDPDCSDGVDDDLDGDVDCADADCATACDVDQDGFVGELRGGPDCDDANPDVNPAAPEVCNDIDDDCDGAIDDDDDSLAGGDRFYADADGDGWGNELSQVLRCEQPAGFLADFGDCDDERADVNPDATEICNAGVDDDCDGLSDEDDPSLDLGSGFPLYDDLDGDGYGAPPVVAAGCLPGPYQSLSDADCDDADPDAWPGAPETCDDGFDQDCDAAIDCDDSDCSLAPGCGCADVVLPPGAPQVANGTTGGQGNDVTGSCGGGMAPDVVLLWTPTALGTYTIDTVGSPFDTVLYVLDGCGGVELACNDDTLALQSEVVITLTTLDPVWIVVDGYASQGGTYVLNIN